MYYNIWFKEDKYLENLPPDVILCIIPGHLVSHRVNTDSTSSGQKNIVYSIT